MFDALLIYLALGAFAGVTAGLLGVGGGLIIVPVLVFIFEGGSFNPTIVMHLALGTSLASIMFTSVSAVFAHQRRAAVLWQYVFRLAPGMLLGSFAGAFLANQFEGGQLKTLFALFEFAVGLYMIAGTPMAQKVLQQMVSNLELVLVSGGIGTLSALLGIGGGTMTVPYLCWRGVGIHSAVAVSSACGMPIALAGALGYLLSGLKIEALPPLATGYIYWPALAGIVIASLLAAPIGARIAHSLPQSTLKRVFGVVLLILAGLLYFI